MATNAFRFEFSEFVPDGRKIRHYCSTHSSGTKLEVCDYCARITGIWMPDRKGHLDNCVQHFNNTSDMVGVGAYYGSTIGRYANRLADSEFVLNGCHYILNANEGTNILHGGAGFHNHIWNVANRS